MPQAANLTIKDGSATPVDVTFTLLTPAAGSDPAAWTAKTKGPTTASQPRVEISSTGFKGGRRVKGTIKVPQYVTGTDGKTLIEDSFHVAYTVTIPDRVGPTFRADGAAYLGNLLTLAVMKEVNADGYAPA